MSERVILDAARHVNHAYRRAGTFEGWQNQVARLADGNSRLIFALSAAFAGPLVLPLAGEGGGFHLRGASSCGKTTALHLAGSAWGGGGVSGFVDHWRVTTNGLESVAALHSDSFLALDELGQVEAKEAGHAAYMLANGVGKIRADRSGEARRPAEWRVIFLSSGEISLSQRIEEENRNRRARAGHEVRVVDIEADAGAGMGAFETLHEFKDPESLARHLRAATAQHYGHAAPLFLKRLIQRKAANIQFAADLLAAFTTINAVPAADGQVTRVLNRFGLVAAAGELAVSLGVLPWQPMTAARACQSCFQDWLFNRGGVEAAEDREAVATVRRFIEAHAMSRFEFIRERHDDQTGGDSEKENGEDSPADVRIINRAGFVRPKANGREYIFLPEAWRNEVCAGMDAGRVARVLVSKGFMATGGDGKPQVKQRVPGVEKPVRCYVVSSAILAND